VTRDTAFEVSRIPLVCPAGELTEVTGDLERLELRAAVGRVIGPFGGG